MISDNKKYVINNFLDTFYNNLKCSPKNLCYHRDGEIYFRYNLNDGIIFLDYKKFMKPLCKCLNIKGEDLDDVYPIIENWIENVFKIKGSIM